MDCRRFSTWVLCIVALIGIVAAQRIRSISTIEACVSNPTANGGFQQTCDDEYTSVTSMLLAVPPGLSADNPQTLFDIGLSTFPPPGQASVNGTRCTPSPETGLCTVLEPLTIRISSSDAVLRYTLNRKKGSRTRRFPMRIPYSYWVRKYTLQSGDTQPWAETGTCLMKATSQVYSMVDLAGSPTVNEMLAAYMDQEHNAAEMQCPCANDALCAPAPDDVSIPLSLSMIVIPLRCQSQADLSKNVDVDLVVEYYELEPLAYVYEVDPIPEIVTRINVDVLDSDDSVVDTLVLSTVFGDPFAVLGTSGLSSAGRVIGRVEDTQSSSGFFGRTVTGSIVMTTGSSTETDTFLETVPNTGAVFDITSNPWNVLVSDNENGGSVLPTPENIRNLRAGGIESGPLGVDEQYRMFYFINSTTSNALSEECGGMGVDPQLYAAGVPPVITSTVNSQTLKRVSPSVLLESDNTLPTCVNGFGPSLYGINVATPCQVLSRYNSDASTNSTDESIDYLPPGWLSTGNYWLHDTYLYSSDTPRDLEVQLILQFSGAFTSQVSFAASGEIVDSSTACFITTSVDTGVYGQANVRVRNTETLTDTSRSTIFTVSVSCDGNGVVPAPDQGTIQTQPLFPSEVADLEIPLVSLASSLAADSTICTATLFAATTDPQSVVLDTTEILCTVASLGPDGDVFRPDNQSGLVFPPFETQNAFRPDSQSSSALGYLLFTALLVSAILPLLLVCISCIIGSQT